MTRQYTYAVARVRALETQLFSDYTVGQLIECPTYEKCLQFLAERGWGAQDGSADAESILKAEEEKTLKTVKELIDKNDMYILDILSYQKLFHNLKAAIKDVCTKGAAKDVYYDDAAITGEEMLRIVREKKFAKLPLNMQEASERAYDAMLRLRDGQLCDVIIDKAALDAIYAAGSASKDRSVRDYAEAVVAIADIKIAVRSLRTKKSSEFMQRALSKCRSLDVERLKKAVLAGENPLAEYLAGTQYFGAADAMKKSPEAFERWCDDYLTGTMKPQKYKAFTVGPVLAYYIARENEIKTVRIILAGKQNDFTDSEIAERVREMYV